MDTQVAGVEAELGEDRKPAVENRAVRVKSSYGLDAGDVDEGGQEAVAEVAGGIAFTGEADNRLGEEASAVRLGSSILEERVEGLDRRDGQYCVAPPAERETVVAWSSDVGEGGLQAAEEFPPRGRPTWRAVRGASPLVSDVDVRAVDGELPLRVG
ncbi:hypothetical protein [Streptomyces sp. NPDC094014]|uniref:hypothetical protein n=1 Tax=Streptomyces sp. NPDC094014 TaxID=3155204 RepID=UPI00342220A4